MGEQRLSIAAQLADFLTLALVGILRTQDGEKVGALGIGVAVDDGLYGIGQLKSYAIGEGERGGSRVVIRRLEVGQGFEAYAVEQDAEQGIRGQAALTAELSLAGLVLGGVGETTDGLALADIERKHALDLLGVVGQELLVAHELALSLGVGEDAKVGQQPVLDYIAGDGLVGGSALVSHAGAALERILKVIENLLLELAGKQCVEAELAIVGIQLAHYIIEIPIALLFTGQLAT